AGGERRDRDEEQRLWQEREAGLERVEAPVLLQEERQEEQLAVEGEVEQRAAGRRAGEAGVARQCARDERAGAGALARHEPDGQRDGEAEGEDDPARAPPVGAGLDKPERQ